MNNMMVESIVINLLLLFNSVSLQRVDVVMEQIKSIGKEAYGAEPFELKEILPPQSDPGNFQYVCQQGFHLFDMQGYFQATDARECAQKCASLEKCRAFNFVRSIATCFPLASSTADYGHLWNDSTIDPYHCNVTRAAENERTY
uniref:Apple domain-containing protein n=1 Tax=Romanomermis culicivorax TaxID=13658 RepID=A0A915IMX6_ROMCU